MFNSFISQEKDKEQSQNVRKTCYWKRIFVISVIAREHVGMQSTQRTLVREHVDTPDTLAREHVSTQGT